MEICCTEHVRNEDIFPEKRRAEEFYVTKRRKANLIGHILLSNCLLTHVMEEKIKDLEGDGKARKKTSAATGRSQRKEKILELERQRLSGQLALEEGMNLPQDRLVKFVDMFRLFINPSSVYNYCI
jgi:hypothetical protein